MEDAILNYLKYKSILKYQLKFIDKNIATYYNMYDQDSYNEITSPNSLKSPSFNNTKRVSNRLVFKTSRIEPDKTLRVIITRKKNARKRKGSSGRSRSKDIELSADTVKIESALRAPQKPASIIGGDQANTITEFFKSPSPILKTVFKPSTTKPQTRESADQIIPEFATFKSKKQTSYRQKSRLSKTQQGPFLTNIKIKKRPKLKKIKRKKPKQGIDKLFEDSPNQSQIQSRRDRTISNLFSRQGSNQQKRSTYMFQSIKRFTRPRNFQVNLEDQDNLFECMPLIQYDKFIRNDQGMQKVICKDTIKILQDKCSIVKTILSDRFKLRCIFENIDILKQIDLNLKLEETLAMLIQISKIIVRKSAITNDEIDQDILEKKENLKVSKTEFETACSNIEIFKALMDKTFNKCVNIYFMTLRQDSWEPLKDKKMKLLLKYLTKSRYNLCEISEEFRILDQILEQKKKWQESIKKSRNRKKNNSRKYKSEKQIHAERMAKLQQMFKNRFNYKKGVETRESKVKLNINEAQGRDTQLLLDKEVKFPIADNRKRVAMERVQTAINSKAVRHALLYAVNSGIQMPKTLNKYIYADKDQQ